MALAMNNLKWVDMPLNKETNQIFHGSQFDCMLYNQSKKGWAQYAGQPACCEKLKARFASYIDSTQPPYTV